MTITPHNAARSFPEDVARVFAANLERFRDEKPLQHALDWNRGTEGTAGIARSGVGDGGVNVLEPERVVRRARAGVKRVTVVALFEGENSLRYR